MFIIIKFDSDTAARLDRLMDLLEAQQQKAVDDLTKRVRAADILLKQAVESADPAKK